LILQSWGWSCNTMVARLRSSAAWRGLRLVPFVWLSLSLIACGRASQGPSTPSASTARSDVIASGSTSAAQTPPPTVPSARAEVSAPLETSPPSSGEPRFQSLRGEGSPTSSDSVLFTEADNGLRVNLRISQRLALALHAPSGYSLWQVALPDGRVLQEVVNPAALAALGVTLKAFVAVAVGETTIAAITVCDAPGCSDPPQSFALTVAVFGS